MSQIYFDYNATTPIDPSVADVMRPFLTSLFGNPSSIHEEGIRARKAVETARKQLAALINCHPDEIIFTSGGSEANNLALKGMAHALRHKGNHIITSCIEHPAVSEVCRFLENEGFQITMVAVDEYGMVDPEKIRKEIKPNTILVSVMHANNETGTIQPIAEIGRITKEAGVIFHSDAAQSLGKIPVDVEVMSVDLMSVAGHKLYAPKGVGALYIRRGLKPEKLIHGADHEQNLRAGTENVMSVAGLGQAAEIAMKHLPESDTIKELRDLLYELIHREIPEVKLNGHPEKRLPNTLNISFPGVEAALLLEGMKEIAASAGAACHSGSEVVSPVLKAMGVSDEFAMGTIRFSLGRMTTRAEIEQAAPAIIKAYRSLRGDKNEVFPAEEKVKLTHFTHSLGCACKINPVQLDAILKQMPAVKDPNVLVGFETSDDAAVYKINEDTAIVQTVDLIPPVLDDPYQFGAVAAANAMSDIWAMGARPLFALSVVGFPKILPISVLYEILKGANDKVAEAGISIIGGHSIEDTEPKFGLVVTGTVHPEKILKNRGVKKGDLLILTKPIGTGIISTGVKRGMVDKETEDRMIAVMAALNKTPADVMSNYGVNACTDVTGFGLLGHLKEMFAGSGLTAVIRWKDIPVLPTVADLVVANVIPGGTISNLNAVSSEVSFSEDIPAFAKLILADAQTSGGLLISVPATAAEKLLNELHQAGVTQAAIVGSVEGFKEYSILIQ